MDRYFVAINAREYERPNKEETTNLLPQSLDSSALGEQYKVSFYTELFEQLRTFNSVILIFMASNIRDAIFWVIIL